ncbi:hypothetical protein BDV11DRAFT_213439 [Aspergillus similis]
MFLGPKIVRGVAAGIGLASESISAHKASKQERKEAEERSGGLSEVAAEEEAQTQTDNEQRLDGEQLEQQWRLDEVQDEMHRHDDADAHEQFCHDSEDIRSVLSSWTPTPPLYSPSDAPKLPYPVILPQRRPKSNKRGFIRSYAPVLADFGIDQETFLDFLETSNKACQATSWLSALNLASIGTIWLPSAIAFVVSTVIQVGTEAAIRVDSRRKTNAYFDKVNEEFFRPRGLYCLVMTWEPESDATFRKFDLNTAISTAIEHGGPGTLNKLKHRFKSSHGKTHNELPFPETAPLIKNLKKREFVANYFDCREQAKFTNENPTSALNMAPKPTFTSRYADPAHPASSGDLLSLVSGGHYPRRGALVHAVAAAKQWGRGGNGSGRHSEDQHTDEESRETDASVNYQYEMPPRGENARGSGESQDGHGSGEMSPGALIGGVKRLIESEEMAAARAMFEE